MLFIFKKKPLIVTLFTDNESAYKFSRPQKAAHFIPDWWKALPKKTYRDEQVPSVMSSIPTMKTCPGFVDLYSRGFIHPMWSDFQVEVSPNKDYQYQYADKVSVAHEHVDHQMAGNPYLRTHNHLKLISPWAVREDSGVKFTLIAPMWNGFGAEDVLVPPGVADYKYGLELNLNLFIRRYPEPKVYEFSFGQPLTHFIPMSDRPLKLVYELVSEEERHRLPYRKGYTLFFDNRAKRAAKLCPYA
jgi:hypothetical protein